MVRPASRWAPRPHSGVAGFPWNQWQLCYGISGNFRVEQVAALAWNRWQASPGIGGSFRVEYAASSSLNFGVEPLQFHSGVLDAELPINAALFRMCFVGPRCDLALQLGECAD